MKTAAVVIDDWKLAIFKKHLDDAGYEYTELPGITSDTLTLSVKFERVEDLQPVIESAQLACYNSRNRALS